MEAVIPDCIVCKEPTPTHLLRDNLCPGCILDRYIPRDYQDKEKYEFDPIWQHDNATAKPKTGVLILDAPSGLRAVNLLEIGKTAR